MLNILDEDGHLAGQLGLLVLCFLQGLLESHDSVTQLGTLKGQPFLESINLENEEILKIPTYTLVSKILMATQIKTYEFLN